MSLKQRATGDLSLMDVVRMADLALRRIIDMAKEISSFRELSQDDQIALLKGSPIAARTLCEHYTCITIGQATAFLPHLAIMALKNFAENSVMLVYYFRINSVLFSVVLCAFSSS